MKKKILVAALAMLLVAGAGYYAHAHHKKLSAENRALKMCVGQFAFCGASGTTATGNKMKVNHKEFDEGVAVCPVMNGPSIANMELMNHSCSSPDGTDKTVWSLFWYYTSVPQAPTWETATTVNRTVVTTDQPNGGMSNMWSFPCKIKPEKVNGVTLADCYGPINETVFPFRGARRVKPGESSVTQAPVGAPNPVGAVIPVTPDQLSK
jgi:hypothetical protein